MTLLSHTALDKANEWMTKNQFWHLDEGTRKILSSAYQMGYLDGSVDSGRDDEPSKDEEDQYYAERKHPDEDSFPNE